MKTTKKVLIALLAVALLIPLVIFPASANAPTNLALMSPISEGTVPAADQFPQGIAPNAMQSQGNTLIRLFNGNTNLQDNANRFTVHSQDNDGVWNGFAAAYTAANPGVEWTTNRNIWFGTDFGRPTAFNRVVVFESDARVANEGGGTAGNNNRRMVERFVIEVATNPAFTPSREEGNRGGTYNISEGAFNNAGWTVVHEGTRTVDPANPVGGEIVANFNTVTARYVRFRTLTTVARGPNTAGAEPAGGAGNMPPSFAEFQVFNTNATGGGGSPQTGETAAIVVGMSVAALAVTGLVVVTRKKRETVA